MAASNSDINSDINELMRFDYNPSCFQKIKNSVSLNTINARKVKLRLESFDLPERLQNEIAAVQNYVGILTNENKLKLVPYNKLNSVKSEEFYPYFCENEGKMQEGKILSVSFNRIIDGYDSIACLYETDRLVVYNIVNDKNLIEHKSVSNLSSIKFFRWHHLPYFSKILIVHGPYQTDLCLWNFNKETYHKYHAQNKILDVAFSNCSFSNLIAITTADKMIEILSLEFKSLLKFSEGPNQKIIFLDRYNIFVCGQQGEYSHGFKAIRVIEIMFVNI
jgi:hypothetical protein